MQVKGITTDIEELVRLRLDTRGFDLQSNRKALASMIGGHKSRFRGRGIDFDEVRLYQPGDEVRGIDWRVTARRGKPHTKVFKEERERPIYIVLDQRESLFFGSKVAFKSVTAARTAALLAWASKDNGDRVGGFLFSETQHLELKPREGKSGVLRYLRSVVDYNQALADSQTANSDPALKGKTLNSDGKNNDLAGALQALNRVVRPGSMIFIISDFYDLETQAKQQLQRLHRHNDIVGILVYDPLEKQAPPPGAYQFSDGNQLFALNTEIKNSRVQYEAIFDQRLTHIKEQMAQLGCPLIDLSTEQDIVETLRENLALRRRSKAK
ncbi:MAG: DUF58 domain-containing protein [Gammaproteobacteria bacterium]|nr:MAG: DUF58 domain-containing protein [Gammaproteobacteria bacterium]